MNMKSAEEWSKEIGSLRGQAGVSTIIIQNIQLDAWKDGQLSGMNLAIEIAKAHKADFISHAIQERLLSMSKNGNSQA